MCGILAYFSNKPLEVGLFQKSLDSLAHRGPDGYGIESFHNNTVHLGHRRLSILDLSEKGKQPMCLDNLYLTFNGEIYNYIEIKKELHEKGHIFKTQTDTEVILHAYQEWGEQCFNKFNGMWALAIYDSRNNSVILSRDRFGVKPLYYYHKGEILIVSSEIKTMQFLLADEAEYHPKVLTNIARGSFAWHGAEDTWIQNVKSLPAGFNLTIQNHNVEKKQWYTLPKFDVPIHFDDQVAVFKSLLKDAITVRMRSDVPIGTCLSGGVDSGSIASYISKIENDGTNFTNYDLQSFCAAFPGSPIDESGVAQKLATSLNINLHIHRIHAPSPMELEKAMAICDGPMHSLAFYPISQLYSYISQQGIKVTLDGQGPDEMLGGYNSLEYALRGALQKKDIPYFWDLKKTYAKLAPNTNNWKTTASVLIEHAKTVLKDSLNIGNAYDHWKQSGPSFIDNIFDRNLHHQFFNQPLPSILHQFDRTSMAYGVECRMPFMDYRIVEFIFSLDSKSKVGNGYTKRILRESMKDILPDIIRLNKTKIGFNAPTVNWYKGPLREWMLDAMHSDSFVQSPYFDGIGLRNSFEKYVQTKNHDWDASWQYWGPIHTNWWINERKA